MLTGLENVFIEKNGDTAHNEVAYFYGIRINLLIWMRVFRVYRLT